MILGLNPIDIVVILACLGATLGVGVWASRGIKQEGDFYLGGRKMGRVLQFFLNFGNSTDPTGAGSTSSEVYRQGAGGCWMSLQTLFITPFFWFTQVWFRRARVITMADLFIDRFNSKTIASMYAVFNIAIVLLLLGAGNLTGYKVVAAMVVKPDADYTQADRQEIADYQEYVSLRQSKAKTTLSEEQAIRFESLDSRVKRDELHSFITYVPKVPFFIIYSIVVASYIMLGGLKAAAVTDAIQGVLILLMSFILIPLGLRAVGGFHGLHDKVPSIKFALLGTVASSEYTWYTILAITFGSLIQILGLSHNMGAGGSAKDENTARFGMIMGGFTKRIVVIAWLFCGLLALALLGNNLADPNNTWGALSKNLLGPGFLGVMIAGMLLGHMPAVGMSSVAVSGLITRNIYEPLIRGKTQKHYLRVGQSMIPTVLAAAIIVSVSYNDVVQLYATIITSNTFPGAVIFLIFFWRRLTPQAVIIGFVVWVVVFGVAPYLVQMVPALRQNQSLVVKTDPYDVNIQSPATKDDILAHRATAEGDMIAVSVKAPSKPCFFESVALIHGETSRYEGLGRFHIENYLLYCCGVPMRQLPPAGIVATRWAVDGLFPFILLIVLSLLTKPTEKSMADRFYVRLKTPVAPTPEEDRRQIAAASADPDRMNHLKLLPGTNWEFMKWTRQDFFGFLGCWGIVGVILIFLYAVLNYGS